MIGIILVIMFAVIFVMMCKNNSESYDSPKNKTEQCVYACRDNASKGLQKCADMYSNPRDSGDRLRCETSVQNIANYCMMQCTGDDLRGGPF